MSTMTYVGELKIMNCGECGIPFAMSIDKYNRCKEMGEGWYCPNGHSRVFTEPHNKQLEQEVQRLKTRNEYLVQAQTNLHSQLTAKEYSIRALKAAKTKIMNRVKNGACPCCNRTFKNLQDHFRSVHPELIDAHQPPVAEVHTKINKKTK